MLVAYQRKEGILMENIIKVSNLQKVYGSIKAVDGISFTVGKGQLFSLLGENGAGKSTTINILCTLLKHDSGTVTVAGATLGNDDQEIKSKIGVVFQGSVLDSILTVKENLTVIARFYHKNKSDVKIAVHDCALAVGAMEYIDQPYGKLSGGQKRRVDIARALLHRPDILFLDEPTTGLDPHARKAVWETVKELMRSRGMTVLLTTHYMEEAVNADYIVMLDHGKIAAEGTPEQLKQIYQTKTLDDVFLAIAKEEK